MIWLSDLEIPKNIASHATRPNCLPLSLPIQWDKPFVPESLTHFYYTDVYDAMTPEECLYYNQLTGMALAEQFIFLEEHILVPIMRKLLGSPHYLLSSSAREFIQNFIDEELKHSNWFWSVLQQAAPSLYPERQLQFISRQFVRDTVYRCMIRWPQHCHAWLWLTLVLEERTVDIARHYRRAEVIESNFARAHFWHMQEEQSHVGFDVLMIRKIYHQLPYWQRKINRRLIRYLFDSLYAPKQLPQVIFEKLVKRYPEAERLRPRVAYGLKHFARNYAYQDDLFSPRQLPRTYQVLRHFPELRSCVAERFRIDLERALV